MCSYYDDPTYPTKTVEPKPVRKCRNVDCERAAYRAKDPLTLFAYCAECTERIFSREHGKGIDIGSTIG